MFNWLISSIKKTLREDTAYYKKISDDFKAFLKQQDEEYKDWKKRDREGRLTEAEKKEQEQWYQDDLKWAMENPELYEKAYENFVLKRKK